MPRIFDNIDRSLLPSLETSLKASHRADICVGYFNLRGWKCIDSFLDTWDPANGSCCQELMSNYRANAEYLKRGQKGCYMV